MRKVGSVEADIEVVLADIESKRGEIAVECIEVWDSMSGKLPSFQSFCEMYMRDRFGRLLEKARWN